MELKDDRLSLAGAKVPPGDDFPGSPCIGLAEWSIPRIPFFRIHAILAWHLPSALEVTQPQELISRFLDGSTFSLHFSFGLRLPEDQPSGLKRDLTNTIDSGKPALEEWLQQPFGCLCGRHSARWLVVWWWRHLPPRLAYDRASRTSPADFTWTFGSGRQDSWLKPFVITPVQHAEPSWNEMLDGMQLLLTNMANIGQLSVEICWDMLRYVEMLNS